MESRLEFFFKSSPWRSPLLMILFIIAIICLGFLKTSKLNQVLGYVGIDIGLVRLELASC